MTTSFEKFRRFILCAVIVCALCCTACLWGCAARIPERPESLAQREVEFKVPVPERLVMENGLIVYYRYNPELPLVFGQLFYPGGKFRMPVERLAVAGAAATELREGSVRGMRPEELDKVLDDLGALIESSAGDEFSSLSFSCLSSDLDTVFDLFTRVALEPAFDETRLSLWKSLALDGIRRRRDEPEIMAKMAFDQLVFGPQSIYAREAVPAGVRSVRRADLEAFHRLFMRPNGSVMAVTGDITKERLQELLAKLTARWTPNNELLPPLPPVTHKVKRGIYVLERDFEQASIMLGHLGPKRQTEDQYDIAVFNRLFGYNAFSSKLFSEIRSKRGLAYAVDGGFFPGVTAGLFAVAMGTRVPEASAALQAVLEIIKEEGAELPQEGRMTETKKSIASGFIFNFSEPSSIVTRAAYLELLGYPPDYNQTYLKRIDAVGAENVLTVAKRRLDGENLVAVAVGKLKAEDIARAMPGWPVYRMSFDYEPHVGKQVR